MSSIARTAMRVFPLGVIVGACDLLGGPSPSAVQLSIVPAADTAVEIGDSRPFTARALDKSGQVTGEPASWSVADPAVALIDPAPIVTGRPVAVADGETTVTARLGDLSASARFVVLSSVASVTVQVAGYPYIGLSPPGIEGWVDRSLALVAVPRNAGGMELSGRAVTWKALDPGVAIVQPSAPGAQLAPMTGVSLGPATITATVEGITGSYRTVVHSSHRPVPVAGGTTFASVTTAWSHSCGATPTGEAFCWGENAWGELGDGTTENRGVPVAVAGAIAFASIDAGGDHTCGVSVTGDAYCWGRNREGQLGNGSAVAFSASPVLVAGGHEFNSVSAGFLSCGLVASGAAYCWGGSSSVPVAVPGDLQFTTLDTQFATCAVAVDGTGYCWSRIALLDDGTVLENAVPTAVSASIAFSEIAVGSGFVCGIDTEGQAWCWGNNSQGQLGDGTRDDRAEPARAADGLSFATITVGWDYACGIQSTGAAYCWGDGVYGQTGNGYDLQTTPVPVLGGLHFNDVAAAHSHTCGVTIDQRAYCWGAGDRGALGTGIAPALSAHER